MDDNTGLSDDHWPPEEVPPPEEHATTVPGFPGLFWHCDLMG